MLDKTKSPKLELVPPLAAVTPVTSVNTTDEQDPFGADNPDLVIAMQPTTVVHANAFGQVVILQDRYPDEEQYVLVSPEYGRRLIDAIERVLAEIGPR